MKTKGAEGAKGGASAARGKRVERIAGLFDGDFLIADDGFLDELNNKELGALGEAIAAAYLDKLGLEVIERNYRCPEGEADLIAYDELEDEVVLVEVKCRRYRGLSDELWPEEAVTPKKQRRYRRIAAHYCMERFPVPSVRFDVVAVSVASGSVASIVHLRRAFDWDVDR